MKSQAESGSVTRWIRELKAGKLDAWANLWDRYFPTLKRKAKKHLGEGHRGARDEEDIALSVLGGLMKEAALADVNDRDGLIRLLMVITKHKAITEKRAQNAAFRGGGKVAVISELEGALNEFMSANSIQSETPESIALMTEKYQLLLDVLPDETFRAIVRLKLMKKTNQEIASELQLVPRTIQRKLKIIQNTWLETLEKID